MNNNTPKNDISTELVKRICDLLIATSFIVILLPLFILISILIPLESKGSPFFLQTRIGKDIKPFTIYKFRTMIQNDKISIDEGKVFLPASKNKHRVTKLGSLLRKTHLDEIPQLFNVIRGDMSLVGVRPDLPVQLKNYSEAELNQRHRLRPGLTGRAQLSSEANLYSNVRLREDLLWIEQNSIKFYFKYLLLSVLKIFKLTGV